jgi:hypothetical protein
VYNSAGKKVKEFESNEEAEKYAIDNHDDLMKEVAEPEAKGEKEFKAKHKIKKSGEKEDGTVVKEVLGVDEGFNKNLVKKASEIALKMGGNMTGAVKKIEKLKKGLSKDEEVAAALQLANEEVSEEILVAAHEINEIKTKVQEDKERYQKFFNSALKKFGVNSPAELKGDKKKEFFDYVDKNYEADKETD